MEQFVYIAAMLPKGADGVANSVIMDSGPEVIKLFTCSTQLSMKFFPLLNVKMPTIVGILTCISWKNNILGLTAPEKSRISWYFYTYEYLEFHAQLSWAWKKFYNLGAWVCTVCSGLSVSASTECLTLPPRQGQIICLSPLSYSTRI